MPDCVACGPAPCTGECESWRYDSDPVCQVCASYADYVTEDLETLCEQCTVETGAEIRHWLGNRQDTHDV